MSPLIPNTNFIKLELKISYPQNSNWDSPNWEPAVITTDWEPTDWEPTDWEPTVQLVIGGVLKFYIPIHKVFE